MPRVPVRRYRDPNDLMKEDLELEEDLDANEVDEDPVRFRLEALHEEFAKAANDKEIRSAELQREARHLSAEAVGLRTAQRGVSEALNVLQNARQGNAKEEAERGLDSAAMIPPHPRPHRSGLENTYDARAHAERYP